MTAMRVATECALAVEAGIPYAAVAMSTDYDCWKTDEPPVSWDEIVTIFKDNAEKMTSVLIEVVGKMESGARTALTAGRKRYGREVCRLPGGGVAAGTGPDRPTADAYWR